MQPNHLHVWSCNPYKVCSEHKAYYVGIAVTHLCQIMFRLFADSLTKYPSVATSSGFQSFFSLHRTIFILK